jgi:RNA polymerase sigma-70 factor (ECF subfamily)
MMDSNIVKLIGEHYEDMVSYAVLILKEEQTAMDLVQDIFVDLCDSETNIDSVFNKRSYLMRSVRNRCLNELRRQYRYQKRNNAYTETIADDDQLELQSESSEDLTQLMTLMDNLSARCCEVFLLCKVENYSYKAAAEKLNISVNTVKTHLQRANKFLKDQMSKQKL